MFISDTVISPQCGALWYFVLRLRGFGHGGVRVGTVAISWVGTLNDWLRLKVYLGSKPIVSVLKDRGLRNHLSLGSLLHRLATLSSHRLPSNPITEVLDAGHSEPTSSVQKGTRAPTVPECSFDIERRRRVGCCVEIVQPPFVFLVCCAHIGVATRKHKVTMNECTTTKQAM